MKNRDTVKTLFLINVTIAFKYTFKKVQKKNTGNAKNYIIHYPSGAGGEAQ